MGNPVKTFLKATAAVGLSFWLAACATTDKVPANDKDGAPDPDAQYEHSNSPLNPPFNPQRGEKNGSRKTGKRKTRERKRYSGHTNRVIILILGKGFEWEVLLQA